MFVDDSVFSHRTMPGFAFDPTSVDYPISTSAINDDDEQENRIEAATIEIARQQKDISSNERQLTLTNM